MPKEIEDPTGNSPEPDPAADSTQFRTPIVPEIGLPGGDVGGRTSDSFYGVGKSIRIRGRSPWGGLALRIAIPILAVSLAVSCGVILALHRQLRTMQIDETRTTAGSAAFLLSSFGRVAFNGRNLFLLEHPDYPTRAEWRVGDHWLVAEGLVDGEKWSQATGFDLNELAPVAVLERTSRRIILSSIARWMETSASSSQIAGLALLNPDGGVLACNLNPALRIDIQTIMSTPITDQYRRVDATQVFVDYLQDQEPEPLIRAVARLTAEDNQENLLGSAVVIMRTNQFRAASNSFLALSGTLLVLQLACMALACWLAMKRVTTPMRRLAADMQAMAEGDFSRRSSLAADEIGVLGLAFNSMAERLRVARANERENSRLESDLAVARGIQSNLLPPQTPRVRGLDIHTAYRPAREIGGDYFDFLPVDNRHMGIVVADASGKSIPAALVMSTTRAILRFVAPGNNSAAETLTKVNAILSVDIPKGMFVSAYYLICDPLDNSVVCASAGHTPLLIGRADGTVDLVNPGGIALGFDSGPIFQRSIREQKVALRQGDRILLYTDGLVECANTANEEYSERRLREFLRRNRELSSHDFVGALLADLDRHRGAADIRDDTTILTFKVL